MEWIGQFLQGLFTSDGWSGWKVAVISNLLKIFPFGKGKMSENEEQMTSIAESIKAIEELDEDASYGQAYAEFYQLCDNYSDYKSEAEAILSRFRNIEKKYTHGILSEEQKDKFEMQIRYAFQNCLQRFKHKYLTNN